jgi:hypothetical protein
LKHIVGQRDASGQRRSQGVAQALWRVGSLLELKGQIVLVH